MLHDKNLDLETKLVLVQIFGERQERLAVPSLMDMLKDKSEEPELREKAAEALGKIKSREALGVLTDALAKPGLFRKAAPDKVRLKAAEALSKIGGERVEYILSELADGEGIVAQYCRELIAQMQTKKGKPA